MALGHIVAGQCFAVTESGGVFFSQALPTHFPGQITYSSNYSLYDTGWHLDTYTDGLLTKSTPAITPNFSACDTTTTFFDGMTIGWFVVAAMAAAWSIHFLRRAL